LIDAPDISLFDEKVIKKQLGDEVICDGDR
jgi:hypothetical protein